MIDGHIVLLFFRDGKKALVRWNVVTGITYMGSSGAYSVDKIVIHKDYSSGRNDYDIAMIKLYSPITVGGKSDKHTHTHTHTQTHQKNSGCLNMKS